MLNSDSMHSLLISLSTAFQHRSSRLLSRCLGLVVLSSAGILSGAIPDLATIATDTRFSQTAVAQSINEDEVKNYARTVLAIEPIRQAAYNEIKKITSSGEVPAIACHKSESLGQLPGNLRTIAVNYCNQSKRIVESNGLTVPRFNAITMGVQANPDLEKRIQSELLRLQAPAKSGAGN